MASWYGNTDYQAVNPKLLEQAAGGGLGAFTKVGDIANQLTADRLKEEELAMRMAADKRAQEQLDLQKQQYAEQQAAKAAGSKYMADLGRTMEAGVVSLADQGKLASLSQRQDISPEERAKQIDALLPKMGDAYQKDTGAQLQLMRGVIAAPTMDARDKVALYGAMADPLEKKMDRTEQFANQKTLQEMGDKKAVALAKLNHDYRLAEQKAETDAQVGRFEKLEKAKQDMTPMYDKAGTRVLYKDLSKEQLASGAWSDKDTLAARLSAAKEAFDQQTKTDELSLKKAEAARKTREEIDKLVASSGNPGSTGQLVAQMRQNKMPESAIFSALSTATGGGPTDFGNQDYDVGRLESVLSMFKTSGATPSGTDKTDQEVVKKEADRQITDMMARRDSLKKETELSPKEQEELTGIETRLKAVDAADKKAAEKAEIEKILSKKPSQLTSKERDILNAYKYGYIPGTNIPAQSDMSGVLY